MRSRTLLPALSVLLILFCSVPVSALADPITGCVRNGTGVIYNAQIGPEPTRPCAILDEEITWSQEGPQGPAGQDGQDGQDGADGTIFHQMHLEDSNDTDCENGILPPSPSDTFGWCPNGSKNWFIIQDAQVSPLSVVSIIQVGVPTPVCTPRFINLTLGSFSILCDWPVPDGTGLNYVIINPPSP